MLFGLLKIGLLIGLSDDSKDAIHIVGFEKGKKGSPEAKASKEDPGSREEKDIGRCKRLA
eukprot:1809887-Prorocentrum_lima.AAC.1